MLNRTHGWYYPTSYQEHAFLWAFDPAREVGIILSIALFFIGLISKAEKSYVFGVVFAKFKVNHPR